MFLQNSGTRLSAAEKQQRYRARRDEDAQRRQQYLEKEREKWKKDIETGKKKTQKDRTAREQRAQRKKWREAHRRSKERKKAVQTLNTPPDTPEPLVSSQPRTILYSSCSILVTTFKRRGIKPHTC